MSNQQRFTLYCICKKDWSIKFSSYWPLWNNSEHFPLWGPIGFLHLWSSGWEPAPRYRTTPSRQSLSVQCPEWCHCSWQELACQLPGQSVNDTKPRRKNSDMYLWLCLVVILRLPDNCEIPTAVSKYFPFFCFLNILILCLTDNMMTKLDSSFLQTFSLRKQHVLIDSYWNMHEQRVLSTDKWQLL